MNKRMKKHVLILFIGVLVILILLLFLKPEQVEITGKAPDAESIRLYFYDSITNCSLNGQLYVNDNFVGNVTNGELFLLGEIYNANFNETSSLQFFISGTTSDCFLNNRNLPFARMWEIQNLEYYYQYQTDVVFETQLSPRQPAFPVELRGFIQKEQAQPYLENISRLYKFENETLGDLTKINGYMSRIIYYEDIDLFNETDYWTKPEETLKTEKGDCEDWSTAFVSLIKSYNESIKCYSLVTSLHLTVFCYLDGDYAIYDQRKTQVKTRLFPEETEQDKKVKLRRMRNSFFEQYGIPPDERKIYLVFNDQELITFNDNEEFIGWALNLSTQ